MIRIRNKRAQITIFVILGLILVVTIAILFLIRRGPSVEVIDENNPQSYIESCTKEAVEEAVEIISKHGGDIEPKGSAMWQGKNITYLCYNSNYYAPCVNQRPMLIKHIESEITNYINPKVEACFQNLKNELTRYEINMDDMDLTTKIQPKKIVINIDRNFKMTRGDKSRIFDNFKTSIVHPIYDLASISMDIASQEAEYCSFDILSYMIIYPKYRIDKYRPGDGDIIYKLRELTSNEEFYFAIRSCALPPGF